MPPLLKTFQWLSYLKENPKTLPSLTGSSVSLSNVPYMSTLILLLQQPWPPCCSTHRVCFSTRWDLLLRDVSISLFLILFCCSCVTSFECSFMLSLPRWFSLLHVTLYSPNALAHSFITDIVTEVFAGLCIVSLPHRNTNSIGLSTLSLLFSSPVLRTA